MPSTSRTENALSRKPSGTLYVLATPIGHMEDVTLRALRTLKEVALIAAEDTRHTRNLLARYKICTSLISYHDHNKEKRTPELLKKLRSGHSIALVTDAGTPAISDPGYHLVRAAIDADIDVVPIPGASAVVAALSVSGLPTDSFIFVGFVPRKSAKRTQLLKELGTEPRTLVFFESPKRLVNLIKDISQAMGNRNAVLARELTKIHEELLRGPLSAISGALEERASVKGECTLLVQGCKEEGQVAPGDILDELRLSLQRGHSLSDTVKELATTYGVSRKLIYEQALKLKKDSV